MRGRPTFGWRGASCRGPIEGPRHLNGRRPGSGRTLPAVVGELGRDGVALVTERRRDNRAR
eukprot:6481080-Lingulodinium_polyedra.AAC.1